MNNNINIIIVPKEYKTTEEYLLHRVQVLEQENEDLIAQISELVALLNLKDNITYTN